MLDPLTRLRADIEAEIAVHRERIAIENARVQMLNEVLGRIDRVASEVPTAAEVEAGRAQRRDLRGKILGVLRMEPVFPMTAADVAKAIDATESATRRSLDSLVAKNMIVIGADDRYALPGARWTQAEPEAAE